MDAFWSLTLPFDAFRSAPRDFLFILALLPVAVLLTARLLRDAPGSRMRWAILLFGWALLFWGARDRLNLVGDGQLWIQTLKRAGFAAPTYREPLSVWLIGALVSAFGPTFGAASVIALVSVLSGLVVLGALLVLAARTGSPVALVVAALAGALPFAFPFFGGVETGGPFLALLAVVLVRLGADLPVGRLRPLTLALVVALPGCHITGLLVLPALVLAFRAPATLGRPGAMALAAGVAMAGAAAAALLPATRADSTFGAAWSAASFGGYALDMLQGTLLMTLPVLPLLLATDRRDDDRFRRFLDLAIPLLLLFPLIGRFRLGAYRDLNLFAPLGLLAVAGALSRGAPAPGRRRLVLIAAAALFGIAQLAALLSFGRGPAGLAEFTRRLESAPIAANDRAYGYETLGLVQHARGEPTAARASIRRAAELDPGNDRLAGMLGGLDLAAGDTSAALPRLVRGLRSVRRRDVSVTLARLDMALGRPRQAIDHLALGWSDRTPDRTVGSLLAAAYLGVGSPDSALGVARLRREVDPEDAAAWFNEGVALWALDGPAAAATALRNAARLMPDNPVFRERVSRLEVALRGERAEPEPSDAPR